MTGDTTCCTGHHAMGCTDDPPWSICCWRCTVNPSPSPEAFVAAMSTADPLVSGRFSAALTDVEQPLRDGADK